MNIHKNAGLTKIRRFELVQDITIRDQSLCQAGVVHGVTAQTARKWMERYLSMGRAGLVEPSS